jgi:hypothetical protein
LTTPFQTQANGLTYTVVEAGRTWFGALITGTLVDEIFGDFNTPGFAVQTSRNDLGAVATENGLYAVTGYRGQSFPQVTPTTYEVNLVLSAPGFQDLPVQVTILPSATFPVVVPPVVMRRLPVRIQGRVVSDTTGAPIQGASVLSVNNPTPPPNSFVLTLRSPLYSPHALPVSVQKVTMTSTGSATLTSDANGGASVLNLSTRTGLAAGSIVQVANVSLTLVEYGVVDHLGPGAAGAAGQVFLRNALNRTYLAGAATTVQFVNPTAVGAAVPLTADADAGDGVLLASALLSVATVAVDPGAADVEYHEIGALTDSEGYYGLDGMGRVKEIYLQASQGASTQVQEWFVEYDQAVNVVDFQL